MSDEVPARHDRLAAAMLPHIADAMKEAVKWVMEPEMLAIESVVEKRVRAKIAAEIAEPSVWPDPMGVWTADKVAAALAMKAHVLRRLTQGDRDEA